MVDKSIKKLPLLLALLFASLGSKGQDIPLINFTTENGLPSSEVHDIYQDRFNRIWFATDNGISIYDSYKFRNYGLENGLTTLTIFDIYEDPSGRIWLLTYLHGLLYYDEITDCFKEPAFNKELIKRVGNRFITNFCFDSKNGLWVICAFNELLQFQNGKLIRSENFKSWDKDFFGLITIKAGDKTLIAHKNLEIKSSKKSFIGFEKDHQVLYPNQECEGYEPAGLIRFENKELFNFKNTIYTVCDGQLLSQYSDLGKGYINKLYIDNFGNILVCCQKEGLLLFKGGILKRNNRLRYFDNLNITNVFQDKENNYWVSTTTKGVFFIPSFNISNGLKGVKVVDINLIGNKVLACSQNGDIYEINRNKFSLSQKNSFIEINRLEEFNNNRIIIHSTFRHDQKFGKNFIQGFSGKVFNNQLFVFGKDFYIYNKNIEVIKKIINVPSRIYCILPIRRNLILLGTIKGLYYFDGANILEAKLHKSNPLKNQKITAIEENNKFYIYGTKGNGIVLQDKENSNHFINITTKDKLISNNINGIYVGTSKVLWVATNKGISKIYLSNSHKLEKIESITNLDGLVSNDIQCIFKYKSSFYIGTTDGVSILDTSFSKYQMKPPIYYEAIICNFKDSIQKNPTFNGAYYLKKGNRDISIEFKTVSFHIPSQLNSYQYRLIKIGANNTQWKPINNNVVQLSELEPGNYYFEAMMSDSKNQSSLIKFIVPYYFYERWWFKVLTFLYLLGIALFLLHFAYYQKMKNEKLHSTIFNLKMITLREQLKPHYIFNCLSSLQAIIIKNNSEKAIEYLNNFSKLIRNGLNYADKAEVTLEEELSYLRKYLEFENARLNDKFSIIILTNTEIGPEQIIIPNMTLQPIVENAVKHGLKNLTYPGSITLEFTQISHFSLRCKIIDNGDGIKDIHKNLTSKGIKIVSDRIELINFISKTPTASITFKRSQETQPFGTLVEVELPIKMA